MCGRYSLEAGSREIVEAFGLAEAPELGPRYNIAPAQRAAVVRLDRQTHVRWLDLMHWGLMPRWAAPGRSIINARSESIAVKPSFRRAFRRRRCLIPATGFYEWARLDGARRPFHVRLRDGGLFAFAGVWDLQAGPDEPRAGFVILTTRPNEITAPIHDRMPVMLEDRAAFARWLDPEIDEPELLEDLLQPAPAARMSAHPVSRLVNSPANDVPGCVHPLTGEGAAPTLWDARSDAG
jgi:putative SOS response-associated peptidase YedK